VQTRLSAGLRTQQVALSSECFRHNGGSISARMLEFVMNCNVIAGPPVRRRLALIVAGILALFGSAVMTAPAQAGYYDSGYPCSYRCGYPVYRYPAYRPVYRHRCYSCGPRLIYERRYIERQYVERRYGYGGYRRHYGYSPYGYRRHYGYAPYGSYRSWPRPAGFGYGYGGVGRRWSLPYVDGYQRAGYDEQPRPPAPVWNEGEYE
jgi:hypothetical protein